MRVAILGAGGIVGQHMMVQEKSDLVEGVSSTYVRRSPNNQFVDMDLTNFEALNKFLDDLDPEIIVNLAGENNVDAIELNPDRSIPINIQLPRHLAAWVDDNHARLIHCSTHAVFSGLHAPYPSESGTKPINQYGVQKATAEAYVLNSFTNTQVVRLPFVLGVRPLPIGRQNPLEQMLVDKEQVQVWDRTFSILGARQAAEHLWRLVKSMEYPRVVHIGSTTGFTELEIAMYVSALRSLDGQAHTLEATKYDMMNHAADQPVDTTFAPRALASTLSIERIVSDGVLDYRRWK